PPATGELEEIADLLIANINTLVGEATEIGLAAFSYGSLPAGLVATRRAAVKRLAFLGPGGHGVPHRPRPELVKWRFDDGAKRRKALRLNLEAFMLHDASAIDDMAVEIHEYSCMNTRYRSRDYSMSDGLLRSLKTYPNPIQFIWGENDLTA